MGSNKLGGNSPNSTLGSVSSFRKIYTKKHSERGRSTTTLKSTTKMRRRLITGKTKELLQTHKKDSFAKRRKK